jgi:hypothetical protein
MSKTKVGAPTQVKVEKFVSLKIEQVNKENELFSFNSQEVEVSELTNEKTAIIFGAKFFEVIQYYKQTKQKMFVNGSEFRPSKPFFLYVTIDGKDYNIDEFTNFFSMDKQSLKLGTIGVKNDKVNLGRYDVLILRILQILRGANEQKLLIDNNTIDAIKNNVANSVKLLA